MANIFDYMKWRDISFKKVEFNEVDNLILARLSYFPFDGIVIGDEEITLKEAYERTKSLGTNEACHSLWKVHISTKKLKTLVP